MERLEPKRINDMIMSLSQGDKIALDKLYTYTCRNMKTVVSYYSNCSDNIDDILSELYFNIYRYSNSFDPNKNGYAWMVQVAKNLCFRFNKNQPVAYSLDEENLGSEQNDIDRIIEHLFFEEAFQLLSKTEKLYIYLLYWEGWTVREISQLKRVTTASVYKALKQSYKKLKKFYIAV